MKKKILEQYYNLSTRLLLQFVLKLARNGDSEIKREAESVICRWDSGRANFTE